MAMLGILGRPESCWRLPTVWTRIVGSPAFVGKVKDLIWEKDKTSSPFLRQRTNTTWIEVRKVRGTTPWEGGEEGNWEASWKRYLSSRLQNLAWLLPDPTPDEASAGRRTSAHQLSTGPPGLLLLDCPQELCRQVDQDVSARCGRSFPTRQLPKSQSQLWVSPDH